MLTTGFEIILKPDDNGKEKGDSLLEELEVKNYSQLMSYVEDRYNEDSSMEVSLSFNRHGS